MNTLTGELGAYLAAAGRVWVEKPKAKTHRKAVDGPPVLGSRALAIADALKQQDRDRIHADAVKAAAEVMAAFEAKR